MRAGCGPAPVLFTSRDKLNIWASLSFWCYLVSRYNVISRCGVINKKIVYGYSNLTNTVITVPNITLQGSHAKELLMTSLALFNTKQNLNKQKISVSICSIHLLYRKTFENRPIREPYGCDEIMIIKKKARKALLIFYERRVIDWSWVLSRHDLQSGSVKCCGGEGDLTYYNRADFTKVLICYYTEQGS